MVCGLITGYGGGVLRDTLMQGTGVYFTSHPDLIVTCILICAFVFYFRGIFKHLEATVFLADALSVGLFALAGASKAVAFEQGMVLSVIMGEMCIRDSFKPGKRDVARGFRRGGGPFRGS